MIGNTLAHADSCRVYSNVPYHGVHFTTTHFMETHIQLSIRVFQKRSVHYAEDWRLCVYGLLLNASSSPG